MELNRKITKLIQTHNKVMVKLADRYIIDIKKRYCFANKVNIGYGRHWIILPDTNPIIKVCEDLNIEFIELDSTRLYELLQKDTNLKYFTELFINQNDNTIVLRRKEVEEELCTIAKVLTYTPKDIVYYDTITMKEKVDVEIPVEMNSKLFIPIEDGYVFEYTKYLTVGASVKDSIYRLYGVENEFQVTELMTGNESRLHDIRPYIFNHEKHGVNIYHLYLIFRRQFETHN